MDGDGAIIAATTISIALFTLELAGAIGFTAIAVTIYNIARLLKSPRLEEATLAFSLLALSQYLMAVSTLVDRPALSTSLYVASGTAAALGFYPLGHRPATNGRVEGSWAILATAYKALIAVPDVAAGILGFRAGAQASGPSRILVSLAASTFLARGLVIASTVFNPGLNLVYASLVLVESMRAAFAASLLALYLKGATGHAQKEV